MKSYFYYSGLGSVGYINKTDGLANSNSVLCPPSKKLINPSRVIGCLPMTMLLLKANSLVT